MSDTPRTDAHSESMTTAKVPQSRSWPHWFNFASQLERELAEAINEISGLKEAVNLAESEWDEARSDRDAYYRELAEARKQRDALVNILTDVINEDGTPKSIDRAAIFLTAVKGGSDE